MARGTSCPAGALAGDKGARFEVLTVRQRIGARYFTDAWSSAPGSRYLDARWCRHSGGCALNAPAVLLKWGVDAVGSPRREVLASQVYNPGLTHELITKAVKSHDSSRTASCQPVRSLGTARNVLLRMALVQLFIVTCGL